MNGAMAMADITIIDKFVLFWGSWPSQFFKAKFEIDNVTYVCCEQFMMAEKARVFGDVETEQAILAAKSPREHNALGRKVRGFDPAIWNTVCRGIVYRGNLAKYEQNSELRESLLATGDRTIVEASPEDRIWGIGLAQDNPRAQQPENWQGTNWLGIALMQVRDELQRRSGSAAPPFDGDLRAQLSARQSARMKHD
jgi:ribA/ribD-fused uncharacterized protein